MYVVTAEPAVGMPTAGKQGNFNLSWQMQFGNCWEYNKNKAQQQTWVHRFIAGYQKTPTFGSKYCLKSRIIHIFHGLAIQTSNGIKLFSAILLYAYVYYMINENSSKTGLSS